MLACYKEEMAVVQSLANNINIFHCSTDELLGFSTDFQVIGLALTKDHICLWSGKLQFNA